MILSGSDLILHGFIWSWMVVYDFIWFYIFLYSFYMIVNGCIWFYNCIIIIIIIIIINLLPYYYDNHYFGGGVSFFTSPVFSWLLTFFRIIIVWPEIPTTTDFFKCPVFFHFKSFSGLLTFGRKFQRPPIFSNVPIFFNINAFWIINVWPPSDHMDQPP